MLRLQSLVTVSPGWSYALGKCYGRVPVGCAVHEQGVTPTIDNACLFGYNSANACKRHVRVTVPHRRGYMPRRRVRAVILIIFLLPATAVSACSSSVTASVTQQTSPTPTSQQGSPTATTSIASATP